MTAAVLALVVRLLPDREWRRAMLAEHASLEDAGARRRFALGCVRAVLTSVAVLRSLALDACVVAFCAVVVAIAAGLDSPGVRVETLVLVALLATVTWVGRRAGVADGRAPRILRAGGYAVVGAVLLLLLTGPGGHGDPGGWWIAALAIVLCLVAVMRATGRGVPVDALGVAAAAAGAGGLAWWAAMLLSATVRSHPQWALALIAVCVVAAALRGGEVAALGTAFATCLAIFAVAVGTYAALPRLAPDVAPANATDPLLENQIESTDPYVADLLLAALFGLVLTGAVGTRRLEPLPG